MQPADFPKIKICCILSPAEAGLAISYGANALGLVGNMPSGPGVISDEMIADIQKSIPSGTDTFLLTSETSAEGIISHHSRTNTGTIQIVDRIDTTVYEKLRTGLGNVKLVQVIHVLDENSKEEAMMYAAFADALLLDSGNPNLETKQLGGTGRTHNWALSRSIRESVSVPVYLAGGINPSNVRQAFEFVRPYGIDLCSGVRTSGRLDEAKLKQFFDEVKRIWKK